MTHEQSQPESGGARMESPDLSEKGGLKGGQPQRSDERLFMQLLAFTGCTDAAAAGAHLAAASVPGVLYEDLNDPQGIALLSVSGTPDLFVDVVRPACTSGVFASYTLKPNYTMFGRTYSLGYEPDLEDALIGRPRRTVFNPDWRWAVWYPLRRSGPSRGSPPISSARFSRSMARSGSRLAQRTTPTTSGSRVMAWTATTTTS